MYQAQFWDFSCGAACLQEANRQAHGAAATAAAFALAPGAIAQQLQRRIYWVTSGRYLTFNNPNHPNIGHPNTWGYSMPANVARAANMLGFNVTVNAKHSKSYSALRVAYSNAIRDIQNTPNVTLNIGTVLPPPIANEYRIRVHAWRDNFAFGLHYILHTNTEYMDPSNPAIGQPAGGTFLNKAAWFAGTGQPGPTRHLFGMVQLKRSWATGIDIVLT